jgi:hypothetical protein
MDTESEYRWTGTDGGDSVQTYAEQILAAYVQGKYAEKIIPSEITTKWVGLYDEALGHAEIVKVARMS